MHCGFWWLNSSNELHVSTEDVIFKSWIVLNHFSMGTTHHLIIKSQGIDICNNLKNSLSHCTTMSNDFFWGTCRSLLSNFDDAVFWNTSPYEDFLWHLFFFAPRLFFLGGRVLSHTLLRWKTFQSVRHKICQHGLETLGHVTKWYSGDLCTIMNFCSHSTK